MNYQKDNIINNLIDKEIYLKCNCGSDVIIPKGKMISFCQNCGNKINKLDSLNLSIFDIATVEAMFVKKITDNLIETKYYRYFLKKREKCVEQLFKVSFDNVIGTIPCSCGKVMIELGVTELGKSVFNGGKNYKHGTISFAQRISTIEISMDVFYSLEKKKIRKKIEHEVGREFALAEEISKSEYEVYKNKILSNDSINELKELF